MAKFSSSAFASFDNKITVLRLTRKMRERFESCLKLRECQKNHTIFGVRHFVYFTPQSPNVLRCRELNVTRVLIIADALPEAVHVTYKSYW